MKKIFFLFAILASVATSAQSHINIEMLSATYTVSPAVKFRVSWSSVPTVTGETHNAKVWVWIDFLKINTDNTTTGNIWTRAEISATPAVGSSPASTATIDASTNKGFWLNGVIGSYSATITATITNIPANTKFNWCAYTSDCPPFVIANNGTYTLQGTPPFILKAANGSTQKVEGNTLPASSLTIAAVTLTDKTECPSDFCPYTGSDLYRDATHLCGHRPTGAQNWEAWIKDTRDTKLYRIVYMADNKWWLARNVKLASYNSSTVGAAISGCTEDECGRYYTWAQVYASYAGGSSGSSGNVQGICPPGWLLPVRATFSTLANSIGNASEACAALRSMNANCTPRNNTYGWSSITGVVNGSIDKTYQYWYTNDAGREDGFAIDARTNAGDPTCHQWCIVNVGENQAAVVRCYRLL